MRTQHVVMVAAVVALSPSAAQASPRAGAQAASSRAGVQAEFPEDSIEGSFPQACAGKTGVPGAYQLELRSGGRSRTYLLRVPPQYDATRPTPLVLNFHGYTMTAESQESYTEMTPKSNAEGFIVAYPQGIGNSWNAGETCCGQALLEDIDDVGFARDLVAAISADYCVDAARVFSTGFSNGGYMSHRLACEASDLFAAVAPASGKIDIPSCTPPRAVPVIQSHGTTDTLVPVKFGSDSNAYWVEYNGCNPVPETVYQKGNATCSLYSSCREGASVEWCEVKLMGHVWPTGQKRYGELNSTDVFWEFFSQHSLK